MSSLKTHVYKCPGQRVQWRAQLYDFPDGKDICFDPDYMLFKAKTGTPTLFVVRKAQEIWAYGTILREIPGTPYFDIETPCYGGPLVTPEDKRFAAQADEAFCAWCADNNIIAEFVRFHPLVDNHTWVSPSMKINVDRLVVSFDLEEGKVGHQGASMVKRGSLELATHLFSGAFLSWKHARRFQVAYNEMLDRYESPKSYYLDDMDTKRLTGLLRADGMYILAVKGIQERGSAVFVGRGDTLYYEHAASPADKTPGCANFILASAFVEAKNLGYKRVFLGGGLTDHLDDSLLSFKKTMASDVHTYRIGRRVHNNEAYDEIVDAWKKKNPDKVDQHSHKVLCYRET